MNTKDLLLTDEEIEIAWRSRDNPTIREAERAVAQAQLEKALKGVGELLANSSQPYVLADTLKKGDE